MVDNFVRFLGAYKPFWLGLGTLAFDVLLVVVVTSVLRRRIGVRLFRAVHWGTYALWPIALAHALGNGTDPSHVWFLVVVTVCASTVVASVTWRLRADFVEYATARIKEWP